MLEHCHITPHHDTERICKCVYVYMCIAYVDAEVSWMPGIHLKVDLYVHNETHTHV